MEKDRIARLELHKDIGVALASLRTNKQIQTITKNTGTTV